MTEAIIAQIGQLLEQHLGNSKAKLTPALNQQAPEIIAQDLQLRAIRAGLSRRRRFTRLCQNLFNPYQSFKSSPLYGTHQVAVLHDLSGIPELIHGTINNPSSLYEMGPAGGTCEGFMINWMLKKMGWLNGRDDYDFHFAPGKASGLLTHGGSVANLTALAAAEAAVTRCVDRGEP